MVIGEVVSHKIFQGGNITVLSLSGTFMGKVGAHKIFDGASITVVGSHGYRRGRVPHDISRCKHYCGWLARLWARSGPIGYFTEPSLL